MYERSFYFFLQGPGSLLCSDEFFIIEEENAEHLKTPLISYIFVKAVPPLFLLKLCKVLSYTLSTRKASHYVWFHQKAGNSDTPVLPGFENDAPTWERTIQADLSLWTLVLLESGVIVVICCLFWAPSQPTSISNNSFTETCKQPQHQSSQMESRLDHMLQKV